MTEGDGKSYFPAHPRAHVRAEQKIPSPSVICHPTSGPVGRRTIRSAQPDLVLGIDIGVVAALALLSVDGELLDIADMPVLADGPSGRRTVDGPLAATIFRWQASRAFVEMVGARPGEGAVGAFAFGRSRGIIEGVLAAADVPVTFIAPASWKRAVGIPAGKDDAKDRAPSAAISRWPSQAERFARVKDDGRAEAALIAIAGMARENAR